MKNTKLKKIQFYGNKNVISKNLKLYRVKSNLTQADLAAKMQTMGVNIDQQMISRIESNLRFVTDYEFAVLCKILNVIASEMLGEFYEKFNME